MASASDGAAQGFGSRVGSLALSAGVVHAGQADRAISPLHFAGSGVQASVTLHRSYGAVELLATLHAGGALLSPIDGAGSKERQARGSIRFAALRDLGGGDESASAVGLEVRTFASVTEHTVVEQQSVPAAYLLGGVSLGPVVRQRLMAAGGVLEVELAASAVSAMDRPYGSLGSGRSVLSFRPAWAASSRLAWGGVSYSAGWGRHVGFEAAYRLELLDYRDVQPVRHVSSGVTVGLRVRPRGEART